MRLNPYTERPKVYEAILSVSRELGRGALERPLRHLIELRVSQLNGCGFCLAMHSDWARQAGVPQSKLDSLAGWRDDNTFSAREQAGLEIAEAMTAPGGGVTEDAWSRAAAAFDRGELAELLYLVGLMNLYNRVNVAAALPADLWRDQGLQALRP